MSIFVIIGIVVSIVVVFGGGVIVGAHNANKINAEKAAVQTAAAAAKAVVK